MKRLLSLLLLLYGSDAFSQSLKKYEIGNSGCAAYFFCEPGIFKTDYSPDSSIVYTGDCKAAENTYGIICIKLAASVPNLDNAEDLLVKYLDYLKESFEIKNAAGYGKGHTLRGNEKTKGIIDYWEDKDGEHWKIKGWTDGNYIAVLYIYGKKDIAETKTNVFLDGFRLPGM